MKKLDPFLYRFGLVRGLSREKHIEKGTNGKINRYIKYQERRIERMSKENDPRFWDLIDLLRRSSKSYRLLALMNVKPLWYKDMNWHSLLRCLRRLNGICYRQRDTFEIKRTAIPKPDGSKRFINNPGVSWRMYLWILNHLIGKWLNPRISENQHGHRPGKGSVTCWKEILELVDEYPFIYELDFKKFHDKIERRFLVKSLRNLGVTDLWLKRLINLQSPYVLKRDPEDEAIDLQFKDYEINHFAQGVVQGSNLAGFMGLSVLEELKVYEVDNGRYVGYADDGIIFCKNTEDLENWKQKLEGSESGVELKPEKSGFVKYDGIWKKDLSFVGANYRGPERTLYANTHSGKTWKYEWERKDEFLEDLKNYPGLFKTDKSIKAYLSCPKTLNADNGRKFLGFLLSKIWSDTPYENFEPLANRSLRIRKNSFADLFCEDRKVLDLYNISSICYRKLYAKMKEKGVILRPKKRSGGKFLPTDPELGALTIGLTGLHLVRVQGYLVGTASRRAHPMYLTMKEAFGRNRDGLK